MTREELILLSGQVVNGMLSADGSIISKVIDRTLHKQIAESAVDVAYNMLKKIDSIDLKKTE
jgi:hypothetical protein